MTSTSESNTRSGGYGGASLRLAAGSALLLAGCVTLTPAQQGGVDAIRTFVDATARAYNVPTVYIMVGDYPNTSATYRFGMITVGLRTLTSRNRDVILAHELAHYLLGHDRRTATTSIVERRMEQEKFELDANAKAVEILARVRGMNEDEAIARVHDFLAAAHRRGIWASGHKSACDEITDLLRRFPQYRATTASWECAPPEWATATR